tara:strand:+ start:121 stop:549 length:429 start_codon:yes stop_codon:yes gene_type:complete
MRQPQYKICFLRLGNKKLKTLKNMNKLIALLFGIIAFNVNAQDTICVMVTLDELIVFDYQTSEVETRQPHNDFTPISIEVKDTEVLCLHLYDEKRKFRDVTTVWEDGDHSHDTFASKDDVYFTPYGYGAMEIEISEARRRKQ